MYTNVGLHKILYIIIYWCTTRLLQGVGPYKSILDCMTVLGHFGLSQLLNILFIKRLVTLLNSIGVFEFQALINEINLLTILKYC